MSKNFILIIWENLKDLTLSRNTRPYIPVMTDRPKLRKWRGVPDGISHEWYLVLTISILLTYCIECIVHSRWKNISRESFVLKMTLYIKIHKNTRVYLLSWNLWGNDSLLVHKTVYAMSHNFAYQWRNYSCQIECTTCACGRVELRCMCKDACQNFQMFKKIRRYHALFSC